MKQFGTILRFELKNYLKNKIFVGVTLFFVAVIAAVMFFPRFTGSSHEETAPETEFTSERETASAEGLADASDSLPAMLLLADTPEHTAAVKQAFTEAFTDYRVLEETEGLDHLKAAVTSGEASCGFVFQGLDTYTYYVDNLSMYDFTTEIADAALQNLCQLKAMVEKGVSPEDAGQILQTQISHETESLGKDQRQNFFYTYIMIFALYMVILLYGQMVATNVATEKSSRAMELLITSAKPASMMFGKVIASCLAGLLQLIAIFGSAILFFNLNKEYWGENPIVASIFDMPPELLLYMLIFFVLGFFIYAFLFGAIGSTASKLEDINTSVMPLTLLFIAAFIVVMISLSSGSVDNGAMLACSFIPFTSPMAMFTRIAMSTVPFYQILLSIAILVVSVIGVGILSAKIYRVGVLLYGTTPKPGAILKALKKA